MAKTIHINGISEATLKAAAEELHRYAEWVQRKETELITKLAERGRDVASVKFAGAQYDGTNDVSVRVDSTGSVAVIYAEGTAVAFIEFGSGAEKGYGHPDAGKHGLGPGTWSTNEDLGGKGHWDNPKGWYYKHGEKSHGNPPAMAMYDAVQTMTAEITTIAKEVFATA
jgi:hypothetical protein